MAGNIAEAQSLLANPVASLDACVAEGDADDSDSDGEGGDEAGEMMMEEEKEPEQVELTAEQQADIDDGWGVVVKTTRGRYHPSAISARHPILTSRACRKQEDASWSRRGP